MRLLLRYFNSGRIPFGFPDSSCVLALICMGGVLMLLKVILGARERRWQAVDRRSLQPVQRGWGGH